MSGGLDAAPGNGRYIMAVPAGPASLPSQYSSADKVRMGRITGIGKNTIPHS
jgi:hypothetical protein